MVLAFIGVQKNRMLTMLRDIWVLLFTIRSPPCDLSFPHLIFCVALKGADSLGVRLEVSPYRHVVTEI